jgi:phosphohistidine phosphatase
MKTLLLFRHAKSSWKDDSLDDRKRPLNKRGQDDAPRMGKLLREQGILPDLVLCSTAVRARTTLELACEALGYHGEIDYREDLYAFEAGAYLNALQKLPDEPGLVMVVGHNPALEEVLAGLTGEYLALPTAALAEIELDIERWKDLSFGMHARLKNLWYPKEVRLT